MMRVVYADGIKGYVVNVTIDEKDSSAQITYSSTFGAKRCTGSCRRLSSSKRLRQLAAKFLCFSTDSSIHAGSETMHK